MGDLSGIRSDYSNRDLHIGGMDPDPIRQFGIWMEEAIHSEIEEANAIALATVSASGKPSVRMVLLKGYDQHGFVFFTNYHSRKGLEVMANPAVALALYWKEMERQVRIEGTAARVSAAESDAYFQSRPLESQASAIVSPQSQVISDRTEMEEKMQQLVRSGKTLTRPDHWGGYRVFPDLVEFWQGRHGRLHDRVRYILHEKTWKIERLAP